MGIRNYLIEGVSGTGKSAVCDELLRRGMHAIHGDRELAYQGDRRTGRPVEGRSHENHIWDLAKVRRIASDRSFVATFFCGGSRNFPLFAEVFEKIFVLEVDAETLCQRLSGRSDDEWGGSATQKALIRRLHQSREDIPWGAINIDAKKDVEHVVDDILLRCGLSDLDRDPFGY